MMNELNELPKGKRLKLTRAASPLKKTLKGDNLKIYENLSYDSKLKSLNLEVISKLDKFNDVYISAVYDDELDEIIILYHVHRKFFNDCTLYKKISRVKAEKDLYKIIFELLKEHNADPTIIKEKVIFK